MFDDCRLRLRGRRRDSGRPEGVRGCRLLRDERRRRIDRPEHPGRDSRARSAAGCRPGPARRGVRRHRRRRGKDGHALLARSDRDGCGFHRAPAGAPRRRSGDGRELRREAVAGRRRRNPRRATLSACDRGHAEPERGRGARRDARDAARARQGSFARGRRNHRRTRRIRRRSRWPGRARSGRRPGRCRGVVGVSIAPGTTLRTLRERKPLVHQITNYVVMNETANATLALGALPVMAHAREEVEEMVALAGALVLNIGTLSPHWIEAMLLAGKAANHQGIPVVLDPVGAGATRFRTETARLLLDEVKVAVLRGNHGEVATLVGVEAEVRGVESITAGGEPAALARTAARNLGLVASVTGPVDHVSDGERCLAIANGHELLAAVTGTGCMSSAITGCFLAGKPDEPLEAAAEALAAFGVAAEDAARDAKGPGSFHVGLYDALAALEPETLDARARIS